MSQADDIPAVAEAEKPFRVRIKVQSNIEQRWRDLTVEYSKGNSDLIENFYLSEHSPAVLYAQGDRL